MQEWEEKKDLAHENGCQVLFIQRQIHNWFYKYFPEGKGKRDSLQFVPTEVQSVPCLLFSQNDSVKMKTYIIKF